MFSIWCSTCIVRTRVLGVRHWRLQAIGKAPRASMLNTKVSIEKHQQVENWTLFQMQHSFFDVTLKFTVLQRHFHKFCDTPSNNNFLNEIGAYVGLRGSSLREIVAKMKILYAILQNWLWILLNHVIVPKKRGTNYYVKNWLSKFSRNWVFAFKNCAHAGVSRKLFLLVELGGTWRHSDVIYDWPSITSGLFFVKMCKIVARRTEVMKVSKCLADMSMDPKNGSRDPIPRIWIWDPIGS